MGVQAYKATGPISLVHLSMSNSELFFHFCSWSVCQGLHTVTLEMSLDLTARTGSLWLLNIHGRDEITWHRFSTAAMPRWLPTQRPLSSSSHLRILDSSQSAQLDQCSLWLEFLNIWALFLFIFTLYSDACEVRDKNPRAQALFCPLVLCCLFHKTHNI